MTLAGKDREHWPATSARCSPLSRPRRTPPARAAVAAAARGPAAAVARAVAAAAVGAARSRRTSRRRPLRSPARGQWRRRRRGARKLTALLDRVGMAGGGGGGGGAVVVVLLALLSTALLFLLWRQRRRGGGGGLAAHSAAVAVGRGRSSWAAHAARRSPRRTVRLTSARSSRHRSSPEEAPRCQHSQAGVSVVWSGRRAVFERGSRWNAPSSATLPLTLPCRAPICARAAPRRMLTAVDAHAHSSTPGILWYSFFFLDFSSSCARSYSRRSCADWPSCR